MWNIPKLTALTIWWNVADVLQRATRAILTQLSTWGSPALHGKQSLLQAGPPALSQEHSCVLRAPAPHPWSLYPLFSLLLLIPEDLTQASPS